MKEDIILTADPQQMYGKYVAENLYRKWEEVEEKTDPNDGHKFNAKVEKKELILMRGVQLDSDAIQTVQFHIQTGDIDGVYCSEIQRRATLAEAPANQKPWKVQVERMKKANKPNKHTVILYAKTIIDALAITEEYMERTYEGVFEFKGVGSFDNAVFVSPKPREVKSGEKAPELNFYIITVTARWRSDDSTQDGVIVLQAENVDEATEMIEKIITDRREAYVNQLKEVSKDKERIKVETEKFKAGFVLTLNEAKIIKCTDIVPKELSDSFYPEDRR